MSAAQRREMKKMNSIKDKKLKEFSLILLTAEDVRMKQYWESVKKGKNLGGQDEVSGQTTLLRRC